MQVKLLGQSKWTQSQHPEATVLWVQHPAWPTPAYPRVRLRGPNPPLGPAHSQLLTAHWPCTPSGPALL